MIEVPPSFECLVAAGTSEVRSESPLGLSFSISAPLDKDILIKIWKQTPPPVLSPDEILSNELVEASMYCPESFTARTILKVKSRIEELKKALDDQLEHDHYD